MGRTRERRKLWVAKVTLMGYVFAIQEPYKDRWRLFAPSGDEITLGAISRAKWEIAMELLLSLGWSTEDLYMD